jgi:hypothetical protein
MAIATKTDVFNRALSFLGKERVTAPGDEKETARLLLALYDQTLDYMLEQHPWSFAKDSVELAESGTTIEADGWDYKYALPVKFLQVVSINNTDAFYKQIVPYEIIGTDLYCNENPAYLKYIQRETVVGRFSAKFFNAFCYALSRDAAKVLTSETGLLDIINQKAEQSLAEAKAMDGRKKVLPKVARNQFPTYGARNRPWI